MMCPIVNRTLATTALAIFCAMLATPARGAVIVQAPTFTTSSTGGAFDVPVLFDAGESAFPISGYFIDLRVTRTLGTGTLTLTGGGAAATNPVGLTPVFIATAGPPAGGGFNANSDSTTFTVANGTGLFIANYTVSGTGTFALSFVTDDLDGSNLYNGVTAPQPPAIEFNGGTITVTATPVPEPASSLALMTTAGVLLARRRGR